ncbi:serine palmitoyl transferase subunit [Aspergillus saccharolyticus JOP 1030-1]|uniref:Serine palmitoyl transferase subunit n=1 Tax=Aspergillus saccharolyticus JOP 1030-1 TaxID=1450539 RepID=A0A318ZRS6_9EURO|nr:serine palmitoyl transferase subunit [Aspergillus saccharolyticus JOP 1030-1]PYH49304.1 serine palmitoyl transferase subunit [Aspergillus saccharolyticus JOP 1030-1]
MEQDPAQYGLISHASDRYSCRPSNQPLNNPTTDQAPYFYVITTYLSYTIIHLIGLIRDLFGIYFKPANYRQLRPWDGYAPWFTARESVYTRRMKVRLADCLDRPTTGVPGRFITLLDRVTHDNNRSFKLTGARIQTLNLGSYNYLGFAQSKGTCADRVEATIRAYGISAGGARADVGGLDLHVDVEQLVARFVRKEASIVFSAGFGTNATIFPALVGPGCLILSDELNHASLRFGARLSGASIVTFRHNDMHALEGRLREAISQGQPATKNDTGSSGGYRPWKKILVVVEGLYSMEGTFCNLPAIIALKRRYKFHLFLDEAHSIGALGPEGRGVCDYFGIDSREIDILMGTLTKSFGAIGGYIAADGETVRKLRAVNAGVLYSEAIAPALLAQISASFRILTGELLPGQKEERLQRLAFNSRYLRLGLKRLGFIVYGDDDSPVIPLILYNPGKMTAFSRMMLARGISVVVVPFPAVPLELCRVRFCVSAAHNVEDLNRVLAACDEIGDILRLKFSSGVAGGLRSRTKQLSDGNPVPPRWKLDDVVRCGAQDVQQPLY